MTISKINLFVDGPTLKRICISRILLFICVLLTSIFLRQSVFAVVVTSLRHTHVSSTSLSLSWDDAVGNTAGYQMFLSSTPGFAVTTASGTTPDGVATTSYINLRPNTTYTFVVKDAIDPDSSYLPISTFTHAVSPGIAGFQIFATSATIYLDAGENNIFDHTYTTSVLSLLASTGDDGNFSTDTSSKGYIPSKIATFSITGLLLNTNYAFQAAATNYYGLMSTATTVIASTYTTSAPPSLDSYQIFTTSISVVLTLNGNATSTPLMISTGTDGNFNVVNSSVATYFNGPPTTLVISNLSTATPYAFQAGTRGTYPNASTQTIIINSSTHTLATAPSLDGFQVFATSIAVRINPNTNPNGTMLSVSTNAFGVASSSVGATVGVTTLTITNLIPNTTYNLNIGAFNLAVDASTQSPAGNEISTRTLAAAPTVVGFQVFTTSISVTLGRNGNPVNTPLMISTGTAGDFNIARSSVGVYDTGNTTLVIIDLEEGGLYGIQAGARDTTVNASTQSTIVTASTITLGEIGVEIIGSTTNAFGNLDLGISTVTVSSFTIRNIGNITSDYKVRATTNTTGTSWALTSSPGLDQISLRAVFNPTRPATSDFGSEDILTNSDQTPDSTIFAMGASSGTAVAIREERYLWLRTDMPTTTSTANSQELLITITGSKTP